MYERGLQPVSRIFSMLSHKGIGQSVWHIRNVWMVGHCAVMRRKKGMRLMASLTVRECCFRS